MDGQIAKSKRETCFLIASILAVSVVFILAFPTVVKNHPSDFPVLSSLYLMSQNPNSTLS